ncbi:MAG: Ankyrin [Clostridiaceae bacterium]|jgi:ankyrin repeat protein|nr:Ankyrin [Clostridiaceae bacterium]
MSEIKVAFSSKIEEQLNRLGIRIKKDFPNSEMKFNINNQGSYTAPLAFSQFLWGYEWDEYEFRITQKGKDYFYLEYEKNDIIVIFTTDWVESKSGILDEYHPNLCIGRLYGAEGMEELLIAIDDENLENPGINVVMPDFPGGMGTLGKLEQLLSYLEIVPMSGIKNKINKEFIDKTQTEDDVNVEFSKVISAFVDGAQQDNKEEEKIKLQYFNKLCNEFFNKHPEASIASIANGLVQLGVPYEQAIGDVSWARCFGTGEEENSSQPSRGEVEIESINETTIIEGKFNNPSEEEIREFIGLIDAWESDEVKVYVKKGMPVNLYFNGTTPIIKAVEGGFKEIIEFFIAEGADLEAKDKDGDTALHTAINWLRVEVVELLIKAGADLTSLARNGNTVLTSAVKNRIADIDLPNKKKNIIGILLEAGADVNQKNADGTYTLWHLAEYNSLPIIEKAIKCRADVNMCNENGMPLMHHLAVKARGYEEIIDALIKAGADPLAVNSHGWNLYMIAVWFKNEKLQELLKSHKADVVKDEKLGFFAGIADGKLSEVKKFIEDGIDINSKFINGESVVTIAAAFEQEEVLKYFIEAGVDINLCNDFGTDAFGYAEGKEGILKILNEYKEN